MTTEVTINGNTVWRDDNLTHRWYDAVGPNVCKLVEDFVNTPFSAADAPAAWLTTLVEVGGNSTAALVDGSPGGEIVLTGGTNDNDGLNAQLLGEAFHFGSRYPTYFGARFKISDITLEDVGAGLCIGDTSVLTAVTNGLYFRKENGSTSLCFVAEKSNVETSLAVATMVANTYITAEYLYLGGIVYVYINGVQVAELADSAITFPNVEYLTPTFAMLNGEAASKTATFDWIKAVQIQATA